MTHEENLMLTGVNPGTPLHEPLSRYWYPMLRSELLQDRHTRKVRLLGENFVIARRGGELFALEERCPHRQASLVLGRVEDGGLRCLYHGWLMDCDGTVKETPNESDTGGRPRLRIRAPAVRDAGGLIWLNICEVEQERCPFPDMPWLKLPLEQIVVAEVAQKTNWVQAIEGSIDSSHTTTLHQDEIAGSGSIQNSTVTSKRGDAVTFARPSADPHPRMNVRDTDFGFIYGALRRPVKDPDKMVYVRATAFAYPCYVTFPLSATLSNLLVFVPVDDDHAHFYSIWYSATEAMDRKGRIAWSGLDPERDLDEDGYLKLCSLPNFGQDRAAIVAGRSFSGFKGINVQDTIIQESMGPVVDRTKEHLGPADIPIVHFRRLLLAMARGENPAATAEFATRMSYAAQVARDGLVPVDQDWTRLYADIPVGWQAPARKRAAAG